MEKRISYSQFQQVKSAAKMMDPNMRKIESLMNKIKPLEEEIKTLQSLNNALEEGIVKVIGVPVYQLVKKVIEPTGAVGKDGKPIKVTKYLPTDIVTYDEQKKVYVIETKDAPATEAPTTSEEAADFHSEEAEAEVLEMADASANEQEAEGNGMPWENN
jgi:hypothetical protein